MCFGFFSGGPSIIAKDNDDEDDKVVLGIDNLDKHLNIFDGKKVGLITNPSGINSEFESSIDVLYAKTELTTLFAAEHGIRGNAQAGDNVGDEVDEVTDLPVHSLYGSNKKPTPERLENLDVLCYDMQDVGARFYTYINTLAYAMEACAENNKKFVVFDRPNPIGGEQVQGTLLDPQYSSFVGMYPIVQRYGLTIGEYAKFINEEFDINCDLEVVPMAGWDREMYYDETGLDTWVMPSPNMPTLDTAIVYTGTCVFEGTNLSEGRGTTRPFELIGAPWIDSLDLAKALNDLNLPGAKFRPASFKPTFSKHSGKMCGGVQVYVTDREEFNSVKVGLAMLYTVRDMYQNDFEYLSNNFIDKLVGNSYVREGKYTLEELFEIVDKESKKFEKKTNKYHIYGDDIDEDDDDDEEDVKKKLDISYDSESLATRYRTSFKGYKGKGGLNIYPEITEGKPNEVGVSSKLLDLVDNFIEDETKGINPITGEDMIENNIVTGEFPGATLAVVKDGKIIKESSYGHISLWDKYEKIESPIKTNIDTLYDVASNTKMFATNYALMKLVYEGKLDVDDKVNKCLPHYKDNENSEIKGKDNVTIRNLLYHNAGHEPSIEFYDKDRAGNLYAVTKEDTIRVLGEVPLIYEVGTEVRYSDLDYMILGHIVEVITEMPLDKYVEESIYKPLGLERTCFNPLDKGFAKEEIAATERNGNTRDGFIDFENVREYTLQGEVHDEKAFYSMEGVSGHAGLFSTAKELAILSQVLLNGGSYGNVTLFDEEVIDEFIKPSYTNPSWGLGWNIQDGERNRAWMFSPYTYNTVGHTGWTGTLTSIDFENDVIVVLLTNQRNTPCPKGNFEAMKYETGRYGSITTLVYEAILKESKSKTSKLEGITDYEDMNSSQTDFIFPDENPSSRVLVRDKRGFYGYEGLGNMIIENEVAESFDIFINGNKVKLKRNYNDEKLLEVNIGEYVVDGVNTIHVDNIKPEGSKINVKLEYPEVVAGSFKAVNIEEENIELVKKIIEEELNYELNGTSLALAKDGVLYESASYGSFSEELINLGNATEIYSTLLAVNKLIYEEKISYSDNISEFLDVNKDISIKNLLEHTSGLPSEIEYENIKDKCEFISNVNSLALKNKEYEYSEYNYILLGLIVEEISGESLENYVEQNIYIPLGLKETGYSKENNKSSEKEKFNNRVFDGVSGGSGLYSTAEELVVLSQVIINYGGYGSVKLFDKDTTTYSISPVSSSTANAQGFLRVAGTSNIDKIGPYGDSKFIGFESDTGLNIIIDIYSSNIMIFGSEYENDMLLSAKGENILSLLYESLISYERKEDFLEDLINDSETRYEEEKTENNLKALEAIKKLED